MERLEHFFRLKDHKTTVSTEIAAGFTTFITMSYIILVNPELSRQPVVRLTLFLTEF